MLLASVNQNPCHCIKHPFHSLGKTYCCHYAKPLFWVESADCSSEAVNDQHDESGIARQGSVCGQVVLGERIKSTHPSRVKPSDVSWHCNYCLTVQWVKNIFYWFDRYKDEGSPPRFLTLLMRARMAEQIFEHSLYPTLLHASFQSFLLSFCSIQSKLKRKDKPSFTKPSQQITKGLELANHLFWICSLTIHRI